jgi:hypothetical protein
VTHQAKEIGPLRTIELSPREVALVHAWLRVYRGDPWDWCPLEPHEWPLGDPLFDELLWTIAGGAASRGVPHAAAFLRRVEAALGKARIAELYGRMSNLVGQRIGEIIETGDHAELQHVVVCDLADRDARFAAAERDGFAVRVAPRLARPH